jgi:hypothetical protein
LFKVVLVGALFKGKGGRYTWIFVLGLVEKEDEEVGEGVGLRRK